MRLVFTFTLLTATIAIARQPIAEEPQERFGVKPKLKAFPQATAKQALKSALTAIERGDTEYLLAHLLDPGFVELRVADRARQFEAEVELRLSRLRDLQIRNRDQYKSGDLIPTNRGQLLAMITDESRKTAFKQLARDVVQKVLDDPESYRDMRKLLASGTFDDTGTEVKVTHPDVKFRALYLRKIDNRWFLENRQEDLPPPKVDPKKGPGM